MADQIHKVLSTLNLNTVSRVEAADLVVNGALDPTKVAEAITIGQQASASLDVFFVLVSGVLVFLMQAGFAMLTAGSVRTKNVKNVLLKNVLDACVGAIAYFIFGWAFAYGEGSVAPGFIGSGQYALSGGFGQPDSVYSSSFVSLCSTPTTRHSLTHRSMISSSNGLSPRPPPPSCRGPSRNVPRSTLTLATLSCSPPSSIP